MSKLKILAAALILPLAIVKAEDKVWKARVTVEAPDGTKTQSVSPFLPDDPVKLPIDFGSNGQCVFEIQPFSGTSTEGKPGGYEFVSYSIYKPIFPVSNSAMVVPTEIFSAMLPVAFGKDIQLLKCSAGTITVRLSGSDEKE